MYFLYTVTQMGVDQITCHCGARICLSQTSKLILLSMELTKQPVHEVRKNSQKEVEADTTADGSLCKETPMLQLPVLLTH